MKTNEARVRDLVETYTTRIKGFISDECWVDKQSILREGFICPNIDCVDCLVRYGLLPQPDLALIRTKPPLTVWQATNYELDVIPLAPYLNKDIKTP